MKIDLSNLKEGTKIILIFSDGIRKVRLRTLRKFLYQPEKAFYYRQKRYLTGKCARCRNPRRKGFATCLECGVKIASYIKSRRNNAIQN